MVKKTWDLAVSQQWLLSQPFPLSFPSVREGIHNLYNARDSFLPRVAILLWSIWKSRNAMVFDNDVPKPVASLVSAKRIWAEWKLRTCVFHPHSIHLPPTPPTHKATNWLGGDLHQGGTSRSILMVPILLPEQQQGLLLEIGQDGLFRRGHGS